MTTHRQGLSGGWACHWHAMVLRDDQNWCPLSWYTGLVNLRFLAWGHHRTGRMELKGQGHSNVHHPCTTRHQKASWSIDVVVLLRDVDLTWTSRHNDRCEQPKGRPQRYLQWCTACTKPMNHIRLWRTSWSLAAAKWVLLWKPPLELWTRWLLPLSNETRPCGLTM